MARKKGKLLREILLLGVAVIFSAVPPSADSDGGLVTIGAFLPMNDKDLHSGRDALEGIRMAVEKANKQGGVHGRQLKLEIVPSDVRWEGATDALIGLIYNKNASAIIGALDGRTGHLAEQIIMRAHGKVTFITPWAGEETLTKIRVPWFFRVVPDDHQQSMALNKELFKARRMIRVAVLYENSYDSRAARDAFLRLAPATSAVPFNLSSSAAAQTFIDDMSSMRIDAVILFLNPLKAAEIVKQISSSGWNLLLAGSIQTAGVVSSRVFVNSAECPPLIYPSPRCDTHARNIFRKAYFQRYGREPSLLAMYSYDAAIVTIEGFRQSGGDVSLADALRANRFQGITGMISFNEKGERKSNLRISSERDCRFTPENNRS